MTRFGHHYLSVPDKAAVLAHLVKIQAGGALFYQTEIDFALQVAEALPNARIVLRHYPDKDTVKNFPDVDRWIDTHEPLSRGGKLIVQTTNEPGWGPEVIAWHIRLLKRLKERGSTMKVGILALATGNPIDVGAWYLGDELFRLIATMRDQVFLLLHEYFGGVVTSGIIGGNPDHAGVAPGKPGGENLIPMENWPLDTSGLTLFHVGRHRFLLKYMKEKGIPAPRIIITEFGADFLGDIGQWLAALTSDSARANYPDIVDGWRELRTQWDKFYPGLAQNVVYIFKWAYADRHLISPEVEAILGYAAGFDPNWLNYRTDNEPSMYGVLEDYASGLNPFLLPGEKAKPAPAQPLFNPPIPADIGTGIEVQIAAGSTPWVLRAEPSIYGQIVGYLKDKERVTLYPATAFPNGGHNWFVCIRDNPPLGEPAQGWTAYPIPLPTPPKPEIPPEVPPATPALQTFMIPINLRIEAVTEEAASLLARHYASKMDSEFQQLRIDAELHKCIDQIKSVRVLLAFPEEETPV